jgi:hypothetical protein
VPDIFPFLWPFSSALLGVFPIVVGRQSVAGRFPGICHFACLPHPSLTVQGMSKHLTMHRISFNSLLKLVFTETYTFSD